MTKPTNLELESACAAYRKALEDSLGSSCDCTMAYQDPGIIYEGYTCVTCRKIENILIVQTAGADLLAENVKMREALKVHETAWKESAFGEHLDPSCVFCKALAQSPHTQALSAYIGALKEVADAAKPIKEYRDANKRGETRAASTFEALIFDLVCHALENLSKLECEL